MVRGEVWWASLPPPRGSEPGFSRPVLVVQADTFNDTAIRTVVCVAIMSNPDLAEAPGNVAVPAGTAGLPRDSVVNVSQIITLDRSFLGECSGALPRRLLSQVDSGLRLVLDLA